MAAELIIDAPYRIEAGMVRNDSGPGAGRETGIAPALEHSPVDFERLIEGVRDCAIFMLDPSSSLPITTLEHA